MKFKNFWEFFIYIFRCFVPNQTPAYLFNDDDDDDDDNDNDNDDDDNNTDYVSQPPKQLIISR